jgi:hypothetical protein
VATAVSAWVRPWRWYAAGPFPGIYSISGVTSSPGTALCPVCLLEFPHSIRIQIFVPVHLLRCCVEGASAVSLMVTRFPGSSDHSSVRTRFFYFKQMVRRRLLPREPRVVRLESRCLHLLDPLPARFPVKYLFTSTGHIYQTST